MAPGIPPVYFCSVLRVGRGRGVPLVLKEYTLILENIQDSFLSPTTYPGQSLGNTAWTVRQTPLPHDSSLAYTEGGVLTLTLVHLSQLRCFQKPTSPRHKNQRHSSESHQPQDSLQTKAKRKKKEYSRHLVPGPVPVSLFMGFKTTPTNLTLYSPGHSPLQGSYQVSGP